MIDRTTLLKSTDRKVSHTREDYSEIQTSEVTAPLTYGDIEQTLSSLTFGAKFTSAISPSTQLSLEAGLIHDLDNNIDRYQATSSTIGNIESIDMETQREKTRPTFALGLHHNFSETQRIELAAMHTKESLGSSSIVGTIQYSAAF